ncbi:phage protease [Ferrimonas sp.]|uniref:phage protease n=1 Tax=Ferrimonas sp. TaxID=2080861 RepID=UPI003A959B87
MKTSNLTFALSQAALTQGWQLAALTTESMAVTALSAELDISADDGWVQALPDGEFSAVDGRPRDVHSGKWRMDAEAFAALKAHTQHQQGDLVIDYEHQTLNKEKNGQPAPASGFFSIDDIQYRQGQGLYIKPRWTDKARAHLSAGEYRYFSLVFAYDTATGRPQAIHSGALTNRPGVDGMQPLASLMAEITSTTPSTTSPEKESPMKNALTTLLGLLGITVEGDAEPSEEQVNQAKEAISKLKQQGEAALTAQEIDLTQYVPVAAYNAVSQQLAALTAESGKEAVKQAVEKAQGEGRILQAEVGYYTDLGNQHGLAALTAQLEQRVAIPALSTQQTTTVTPPEDKGGEAALSAEEKQMADAWGMSHDEFAQAKKEQQ